MTIKVFFTCDNCGKDRQDANEILCRKCKPILALWAEYRECLNEIEHLYWAFTRQARAKPPIVANPKVHARCFELEEILNIRR